MRARRFLLPLLVGLSLPLSAHAYVVFIRNPITALKRLIARFKRK
jgi:hypothetical protein